MAAGGRLDFFWPLNINIMRILQLVTNEEQEYGEADKRRATILQYKGEQEAKVKQQHFYLAATVEQRSIPYFSQCSQSLFSVGVFQQLAMKHPDKNEILRV